MENFPRAVPQKPQKGIKQAKRQGPERERRQNRLISLSTAEIRRLLSLPRHDPEALHLGLWRSAWRRRHQADARRRHFRRRLRRQSLQI